MDSKYYIPSIEEFRIGFEYEILVKDVWNPITFTELNWFSNEVKLSHKYLIENNRIRVKYLDQSDIESLGWIYHENSHIYFKGEFKLQYVQSMNNRLEISTHLATSGYSDIFFRGNIKNISELKNLLKQLGIE
jgi:hypothetical protein